MEFDVQNELYVLKTQTQLIRKRHYCQRKSRLDKFTYELLELRRVGASCAELQRFLRTKRMKVAHSTVQRWLTKHE